MIQQQITQDENNMSGKLLVIADPGYLSELLALFTELSTRQNVVTLGSVTMLPPADPPTVEENIPNGA